MNETLSPIDNRYGSKTKALLPYFSEKALAKYRVTVEGEYLIALRKLKGAQAVKIRSLYNISDADFKIISDLETKGYKNIKATDHDVKAVEYFIKEKIKDPKLTEWVHFALTSEDVNNIAYALMIRDSLEEVIKPKIKEIVRELDQLAKKYKSLPMLARTHGQPASPTTFGKEMKVFVARLEKRIDDLSGIKIQAKLNGASGNWNAHVVAFPNTDWPKWSQKFIEAFNKGHQQRLEANLITTQIECHDSYVAVFDTVRQINTILLDFNQDIWRYISDEWIVQKPKEGTIGSSTMPHKINPIKFENSEGNLGIANALFEFFARKLPISRLQRDLSDSTVERNIGVAFAHSLVAYEYLLAGLSRIEVNKEKIVSVLENHPEVIAEAIQTILRREGEPFPYEKLKDLTRGKKVTMEDFSKFIDELPVSEKIKKELRHISPKNYIGIAPKIV
ncbi:MAG TPA: adenylosuccinate lyase [Candidatus Paceibacterota bacterium]|nr:adenylosuccinate lyase [Candidatus Paceibacterota bacterium]